MSGTSHPLYVYSVRLRSLRLCHPNNSHVILNKYPHVILNNSHVILNKYPHVILNNSHVILNVSEGSIDPSASPQDDREGGGVFQDDMLA